MYLNFWTILISNESAPMSFQDRLRKVLPVILGLCIFGAESSVLATGGLNLGQGAYPDSNSQGYLAPYTNYGTGAQSNLNSAELQFGKRAAPVNSPYFSQEGVYANPGVQAQFFGGGGFSFDSFDFGGLNFGDFDLGSLDLDAFNLDLSEFNLDFSDFSLAEISDTINTVSNTLQNLNTMALNASQGLSGMKDKFNQLASGDIETAFGVVNPKEMAMFARDPKLFSGWLSEKIKNQEGYFAGLDIDGLKNSIDMDFFKSSDIRNLLANSGAAFNQFKALKNTLDVLKGDTRSIIADGKSLLGEIKGVGGQLSEFSLSNIAGNIGGHLERMAQAELKNAQLGDSVNGSSDPASTFSMDRVSTPGYTVQGAVNTALSNRPTAYGANLSATCTGLPNSTGSTTSTSGALPTSPAAVNALSPGDSSVFAGPLPQYRPSDADGSVKILWRMFGDPGGMGLINVEGDATSPNEGKMSRMFLMFNTAVAAIAALWFTFTMLSAGLQGAHDGEFLGKRYHSFWLPIRAFIGGILIIPLPLIGYSAAQILTLLATTTGIGIANATAGYAVGVLVESAPEPATFVSSVNSMDFMSPLMLNSMCVAKDNVDQLKKRGMYRDPSAQSETLLASDAEAANVDMGLTIVSRPDSVTLNYGAMTPNSVPNFADHGFTADQCGTLTFRPPKLSDLGEDNRPLFPVLSDHNREVVHDAMLALGNKQIEAFVLYAKVMNDLANSTYLFQDVPAGSPMEAVKNSRVHWTEAMVKSGRGPITLPEDPEAFMAVDFTQFRLDYAAYIFLQNVASGMFDLMVAKEAAIQSSAIACSTKTHVEEGPNSYGWIGLGFYNVHNIVAKGKATSVASSATVESTSPQSLARQRESGKAQNLADRTCEIGCEEAQTRAKEHVAKSAESSGVFGSVVDFLTKPFTLAGDVLTGIKEYMNPAKLIDERLRSKFNNVQIGFSSVSDIAKTGISVLSTLDSLVKAFFGIVLGVGTVIVTLTATGLGPFLNGIFELVVGTLLVGFSMITVFIMPAAYFGIKLAMIIPMIPVLIWIGVILDWMVIVIESMIASPYWAMAHLDGDGEGMGRNTAHGYIFILNLLFRPAILVITFSLVTSVLSVILGFANGALGGMFNSLINNPESTFIMKCFYVLGALSLMTVIFENMLTKAYSILSVVPDKVFTWIGGNFGSNVSGGLAENIAGGASGATQAATSAVGNGISAAGNEAGKQVDKAQQRQDQKALMESLGGLGQQKEGAGLAEAGQRQSAEAASAMESAPKGSAQYDAALQKFNEGNQMTQTGQRMQGEGMKRMEKAFSSPFVSRAGRSQMRSSLMQNGAGASLGGNFNSSEAGRSVAQQMKSRMTKLMTD